MLVSARLDRDEYDWLKTYGEGYSTRINNPAGGDVQSELNKETTLEGWPYLGFSTIAATT